MHTVIFNLTQNKIHKPWTYHNTINTIYTMTCEIINYEKYKHKLTYCDDNDYAVVLHTKLFKKLCHKSTFAIKTQIHSYIFNCHKVKKYIKYKKYTKHTKHCILKHVILCIVDSPLFNIML